MLLFVNTYFSFSLVILEFTLIKTWNKITQAYSASVTGVLKTNPLTSCKLQAYTSVGTCVSPLPVWNLLSGLEEWATNSFFHGNAHRCTLSSENSGDFISAPFGQWVQRGVARRQNESSDFLPALGTAVHTVPVYRAPPFSFLQDLHSPAGGSLCRLHLTVGSRSTMPSISAWDH